jgi:hypothetical protein
MVLTGNAGFLGVGGATSPPTSRLVHRKKTIATYRVAFNQG